MNPPKFRFLRATAIGLLGLLPLAAGAATTPVHYGLFGNVHVASPAGTPQRTVVFLSDRDGWDARAEALATAMAGDGALVLGVDLPAYLEQMLSIKDRCSLPGAHVEEMSDWMQRNFKLPAFAHPLLVGDGAGATFAYAIDAQAPKGTFAALLTLGYDFAMRLPKPVCAGDAGAVSVADARGNQRIVPVAELPNAWWPHAFAPQARRTGIVATLEAMLQALGVEAAPAAAAAAPAQLVASVATAMRPAPAAALPRDVADLPLIEVPARGTPIARVAIILTGDGGWAGLDIAVADQLAARGIAVVGLSSVKYFWQTRTPDEAAAALARIVGHYAAAHAGADFVVIGYSFGASLAPVLINRLPAAARARVAAQVLISPDDEAVFEIHVGDWFGSTHHEGALPLLPEIARSAVPVICVHGADEGADSFCAKLAGLAHLRQLELPGGHHYDGDYDRLGAAIVNALPARR
jgi:type IV secretory pathway VirJ component